MSKAAYRKAIIDTFRVNAVHTAHIIDDGFPTYGDLAANDAVKETYKEWELAKGLYDLFRSNHIPCDVENNVDNIQDVERIRKSDLIILDYNLGHQDTRKSVGLVRRLARTEHFNTIIVYTADPKLDDVWLNFAMALRDGWHAMTPDEKTADDLLADLGDRDPSVALPQPSHRMITDYILGRPANQRHQVAWKEQTDVLNGAGVEKALWDALVTARIRREVRTILADGAQDLAGDRHTVDGLCKDGEPRWLQSGKCFVTIVGKPKPEGPSVEPSKLFDALDDALCAWRPNLLQIVLSEIQNVLESDPLATNELHLREPHTQASLCFFLLLALNEDKPARAALDGPVHVLLDKLVDSVRQKLLTDNSLKLLAGDLFAMELERVPMPVEPDEAAKRRKLFDNARKLAGASPELDAKHALLRLNTFLSSEPFRGQLTTGTIFKHADTHWVCMTPTCDMVVRTPEGGQDWLNRLHPMKPIVAIKLREKGHAEALKEAEHSRSIFLNSESDTIVFDVLGKTGGPSYEFIYLRDASVVQNDGRMIFEGFRVWRDDGLVEFPAAITPVSFEVVGQVRADYASRFLQQTGSWLSRIGVDFIKGAG